MARALGGIATHMILNNVLAGAVSPSNADTRLRGFLFLVSGVLLAVAIGFLVLSAHYWLRTQYAPELATLLTAGVVFGIACICMLSAWVIGLQRKSRLKTVQKDLQRTLKDVLNTLDDSVGQNVRENPVISVLLASMAGYALTDMAT